MIKCSNWDDIVYELLEDPMIQSCGCDGLSDANRALSGLLDISWLMNDVIDDDFILLTINRAIQARNRYCCLNDVEPLPLVEFVEVEDTLWGETHINMDFVIDDD